MNITDEQLISLTVLSLIIMPLLTAYLLKLLGNHTKQNLVDHYGIRSQILLGGAGVVIHELSHLLTACVFLHHITRVNLLEPRAYQFTGTLGSVEHTWNPHNLYESLGNFFIGLAPCFLCSEFLWLTHGFLFSNPSYNAGTANSLSSAFHDAIINVMHPFGPIGWKLLIYVVLIVMVASTGYGLSDADMQNAFHGLLYWVGLLVVLLLVIIGLGTTNAWSAFLWKAMILWLTFLGRGLIYLVTSLIIINGVALLRKL